MTHCRFSFRIISRLLVLVLLVSLCGNSHAQKGKGKTPVRITTLSVRDIAGNYHINADFLSDTLNFVATLDSMDNGDNLMMASFCNEISRRIHNMKQSLRNDYRNENGKIWIDDHTVINDYPFYEGLIDRLAAAAATRNQHYLAREGVRQRTEELKRQREAEEAEAQRVAQQQSDIAKLKERIARQHSTIASTCDIRTIKDKSRAREYKNLYYAYLAVYNRYNLTQQDTAAAYLRQLDELATLQRHMLDSTLSSNNYTSRIDHFPEQLRDSAGVDYSDIIRAYNKYFLHTAVSITFNTAAEYYQYVRELDNIHHVQLYYLDVVSLRKTIDRNRRNIVMHYEIPYANPVRAYESLHASYNFTPTFNDAAGAEECIGHLTDFIDMQQIYLHSFGRLDAIGRRADTIYRRSRGSLSDIRAAYKRLDNPGEKVPNFRHSGESKSYTSYLDKFEQVQRQFLRAIDLRNVIQEMENRILHYDNSPKVLKKYYRTVCRQTVFTPEINTVPDGELFLEGLSRHVAFQRQCLADIAQNDTILHNNVEIEAYSKSHPNIYSVYRQVFKSYEMEKISSEAEFEMLADRLASQRSLQHIILEILRSRDADEINIRMKSLRDMGQMKQILKLN